MRDIVIPSEAGGLEGTLVLPGHSRALVVFAHGSGSSRKSPRNVQVARWLQSRGLGTLLFDLLTEPEARSRQRVFDIELLTGRVLAALRFVRADPATREAATVLFGASTGAAAALCAAAQDRGVRAVVSRGGRPDLAARCLPLVAAPTLLIVGELDTEVLALNAAAAEQLRCEKRIAIVRGASHLFEEPGCLEEVCDLASGWFERKLAGQGAHGGERVP